MKGKTEMKKKTTIVKGIEFDSRIFTAINKKEVREYLTYPYFNSKRGEVVATDGHVMLIQQVDAPESQKSGFVDWVLPEEVRNFTLNANIAKYARDDFYKGKTSNFVNFIISDEKTYGTYPDYPRIVPEADPENRVGSLQDFYGECMRLYYPQVVDILPDGSYKVTTKTFKKGFFVSNRHTVAFDYGLFEKFYKFFGYPDDAEVYYTNSVSPLLAVSEKERKTAVIMPMRFDYARQFVKIEGKKATRVWLVQRK